MATARVTFTALQEGEALPTEFRIFAAGLNGASHDPALFDEEAARAVMADYAAHGVDLIVDLEHDSLAEQAVRSDMRDARAYFKLELRNGELWAVDVRWTPDGERRLREKTQRYISPAFLRDEKTGRVESLLNVGLVAMPATHGAPALVAASKRALLSEGSFEARREAIAAALLAAYPPPAGNMCSPCVYAVELFEDRVVYEYSGKLYMAPYTFDAGAAKLGAPVQVTRTYTPVAAAALRKQAPRVSVKMSAVEAAQIVKQYKVNACLPKKSKQR